MMFIPSHVFTTSIVVALFPIVFASAGTNFGSLDLPNGFEHDALRMDLFCNLMLPHLDPLSFVRFLKTRKSHASYAKKSNLYVAINNFLKHTNGDRIVEDTLELDLLLSTYLHVKLQQIPQDKVATKIPIHKLQLTSSISFIKLVNLLFPPRVEPAVKHEPLAHYSDMIYVASLIRTENYFQWDDAYVVHRLISAFLLPGESEDNDHQLK